MIKKSRHKITVREQQVLNLISQGHSAYDIAGLLYISHHTVKTYKKNLFAKFDVSNCAFLVRKGFENGILI